MPNEEKGAVQTDDEKRLAKFSAKGKKWNNGCLFFFGIAIAWLILMKYTDVEIIAGPEITLIVLMAAMLSAIISLIFSAYYTWRARTLRKEIEYYSTDPELKDIGQTEIPE